MIISILRSTFLSLGVACLVQYALWEMQSEFVYVFLKANITNLQVALLAINATTLGIVLTKIKDIIEKTGKTSVFNETKSEMLLSIKEQITLIAVSLFVLAVDAAKSPPFHIQAEVLQALLLTSFIYSLIILYDTAKSVFVILDY